MSPAAANPHYFPDAGPAHRVDSVLLSGTLEPNVWVDIGLSVETKIEAALCHTSQLVETGDWFRAFLRSQAEAAGRAVGVTYAEGFRVIRFR